MGMRKWIINWLFDGKFEDYNTMLNIARKANESAIQLLESNESLISDYKKIVTQQKDIWDAVNDETDIHSLRVKILHIVEGKREDGTTCKKNT